MRKPLPLLLFAAALSLGVLSCKKKEDAVEQPTREYIADFEDSFGPSFQTICISRAFGAIEINDVKKFVKEGEHSARIRPLGDKNAAFVPTFYFPLRSATFSFNKSNLRKYEEVVCSVYNDSNKDLTMTVGFVAEVQTYYNIIKANGETFTLKANSWNEITYKVDLEFLNMYFNIEEAPGLYFEFEKPGVDDIGFAPNLYMDDLYFTLAEEERKFDDRFILKENEICDFEEDFQKYFLSVKNVVENHLSFDITEGNEEIQPSSGNKMLHIHSRATNTSWVNWSHFSFSQTYMRQTKLGELPIPEVEEQQWALAYDIRFANLQKEQQQVVPTFFTNLLTNERYIGGIYAGCDEWQHVEIVFNKVYEKAGPAQSDVVITGDYILNVGEFHFSVPDERYDYDVYIDNIRLVKREGV